MEEENDVVIQHVQNQLLEDQAFALAMEEAVDVRSRDVTNLLNLQLASV